MKSSNNLSRKQHTINFLDKTIRHDIYVEAHSAIAECHKSSGFKPKSMFLLGPSGAGKSTIVKSYAGKYPKIETPEETRIPVIYISLYERSTPKDAVGAILEQITPMTNVRGAMSEQRKRLEFYLKACHVELIIIDEIHHVLPAHTTAKIQHFADLIKSLMDKTLVSFILVGLPDSIKLLHANTTADVKDQLFRRCRRTIETTPPEPYSKQWSMLVKGYQGAMQGIPCIDLSSAEMLQRLYLATSGLNGRIANLLAEVSELTDGTVPLTLSHFAQAYIEANATYEIDYNPFSISLRELNIKLPVSIVEK